MPQLYLEPHQLRRVNREFVQHVRSSFPMRFYGGEAWWTVYTAAGVLRMCDTVESIMTVMTARKTADARALLRSLYEQAITIAWVAIDPEEHHDAWQGEGMKQLLKTHNELLRYGETVLTDDEVELCRAATGAPSVEEMARAADEYWPGTVIGLYCSGHALSWHGLYQGVYRIGSRPAHGSVLALADYVKQESNPVVVAQPSENPILHYALAAPIFAMALVIAAERLHWLDDKKIRRFNDRATAEVARKRAERATASKK